MYKYDFLVLGSGLAGLSFALKAAEHGKVAIVTKAEIMQTNTRYAQGGIAGVMDMDTDSFEKHVEDTMRVGGGLGNRSVIQSMVKKAPDLIHELIGYGVEFTKKKGKLDLGKEGGHSENRIIHATDATGLEVERVMVNTTKDHPNIDIFENHFAMELLTGHNLGEKVEASSPISCYGAYVLEQKTGKVHSFLAKATVLATGGIGQVYKYTTNPEIATGDGIAMAYRAKAKISNMEFVQFHPTSLNISGSDSFLITEALRGYGAILRNEDGEAFMSEYDRARELAPRDIVARAIDDQLKKRGDKSVYLDVTHLDAKGVIESFPTIHSKCLSLGLDITKEWIPVVPAAHYSCGGVVTDEFGRTTIRQLFACGETACTGVHGANRLASNSLLEALYFADVAARKAVETIQNVPFEEAIPEWDETGTYNTKEWVLVSHNREELQQVMWDYVGIVRSDLRLERALRRARLLYEEVESFYERNRVSIPLCELRNLISVAYLIITAALERKESIGLHYSTDYEPVKN